MVLASDEGLTVGLAQYAREVARKRKLEAA